MNRVRRHWPMPGELAGAATSGSTRPPPPLDEEELGNRAGEPGGGSPPVPLRKKPASPALKRTFGGVLAAGFGLLVFVLSLELIQTVNLLLGWPPPVGWPVLALIFGLIGYGLVRLGRILISIRRLPLVPRLDPGELGRLPVRRLEEVRRQLVAQLEHLRAHRGENPRRDLGGAIERLHRQRESHPAREWILEYDREILVPLGREARERVRRIALSAGASAALSPWRILDAAIAFNAAVQTAHDVLRIHGIRPNQAVAASFAFDTFLNTFLATVVEDVTSDLADSLAAQISAESGASAARILAPKIAEGLTTAVFVRRLGNRMIRRLHPFPE
ncbi:MAG: DUF697 domain-containing protein [Puniceicoccaceae bacterium]